MEVNKKNGNVCFSEETHTYWNENDNEKYISVTTLIHEYAQPFDSDYWSSYKALEKLIPKDNWNIEKKAIKATKKIDLNILSIYNVNVNEFNKVKQNILDEWERKKVASCERGTKIHAMLENNFYKAGKNVSLSKFKIGGKFECRKDYTELDIPYGVYPEYLLYRESDDKILRIAGQADLIIKNGNDISIIDHKSNEKIDMTSRYLPELKGNVKMLYPLNDLDDCNYNHYALQLSTYAWMIQKLHPEFTINKLMINHYDHNNNNKIIECPYLKKHVERLLKDYKKKIIRKKQKEKYKSVEY